MELYRYEAAGAPALSAIPDLPLPRLPRGEECPERFLLRRGGGRAVFCPSDPRQLFAETEDVRFLSPDSLGELPDLPPALLDRIQARTLQAVDLAHPRWEDALRFQPLSGGKKRLHLLAVGDVGGTFLTALKLLGSDVIDSVGIRDVNAAAVERWRSEMGQISWPWDYQALPEVEPVDLDHLFDCDVFLFAAAKSVPPVGAGGDVRMAQLAANRPLAEHYARLARERRFRGLFLVMSDPVDPLCRAAYLASNRDEAGNLDHQGLLPEQIRGLGLGVMNARAAYFAKRDPRYAAFLTEGRSFGPHGQGLVLANSIAHYDDALSQALTAEVLSANLRIRELGFKPFVAPAVSSGAMQLLLLLRGQWHCASLPLGDVFFGCRSRLTPLGPETEALPLPPQLLSRLQASESHLRAIL